MEERDANEIINGLYLGSENAEQVQSKILKEKNITHILTCGFGIPQSHQNEFKYHKIKAIDLPLYKITKDIPECIDFINDALNNNSSILVHCSRGVSRSASIVVSYLMKEKKLKFADAHYLVRSKRKIINLNIGFKNELLEFEKDLFTDNKNQEKKE
jgi:atypical dual specificity phosphatase